MKKVLVIDDEIIIREMVQAILEDEEYEIFLAANGSQGVTICQNNPDINLVITDIVMPEKEGLETIHDLRKIIPKLKIIAISGVDYKEIYLKMARGFGADSILPKPFSAEELVAAAKAVLS